MDSSPPATSWQLVFHGECLEGHDPAEVRHALVRFLKLDEARAARLFSGRRVVLRRGVGMAAARRTIRIYAVMGAALHAEPSQPRRERARRRAAAPVPARAMPSPLPWRAVAAVSVGGVIGLALVWALVGPPPPSAAPAPVRAAGAVMPSVPALPALPASVPTEEAPAELPADMSADARQHYRQRYVAEPGHKAFAISAGGAFAAHAGAANANDAAEQAIARCMAARRSGDEGCRLLDLDGQLLE